MLVGIPGGAHCASPELLYSSVEDILSASESSLYYVNTKHFAHKSAFILWTFNKYYGMIKHKTSVAVTRI